MQGNVQENFNGYLEIFFASVDKNISRKFLKGISLYNNIVLVQACVWCESRQLIIMSLAFILSISDLQNKNF